ncbi:LOW QUALITY PROTEIN: hypothetical protein KUTeg_011868 [Tegillarca granosa]|uniref:HAT C-terminal dimerisation domain-containing protein n=1 Tax=Tegillarca granosa TaxID=220873 RepID=A0ABQ9F361_TEGGR|nr:LOW QUALITY PROTEIN: hypothetical protein KUTeg_011868 [Tegillarca granosa]
MLKSRLNAMNKVTDIGSIPNRWNPTRCDYNVWDIFVLTRRILCDQFLIKDFTAKADQLLSNFYHGFYKIVKAKDQVTSRRGLTLKVRIAASVMDSVLKCYIDVLSFNNYIEKIKRWPALAEQQGISRIFQLESGLPVIVSVLDGTHIRLRYTVCDEVHDLGLSPIVLWLLVLVTYKHIVTSPYLHYLGYIIFQLETIVAMSSKLIEETQLLFALYFRDDSCIDPIPGSYEATSKVAEALFIKSVAAIDPNARGHSVTLGYQQRLPVLCSNVFDDEELEKYENELRKLQHKDLSVFESGRIDHWWGQHNLLLCISVTNVECERVFSMQNHLKSKFRARPKPERSNAEEPTDIREYSKLFLQGRDLEINGDTVELDAETSPIASYDAEEKLQYLPNLRLPMEITFCGEEAQDLGGPRKEESNILEKLEKRKKDSNHINKVKDALRKRLFPAETSVASQYKNACDRTLMIDENSNTQTEITDDDMTENCLQKPAVIKGNVELCEFGLGADRFVVVKQFQGKLPIHIREYG